MADLFLKGKVKYFRHSRLNDWGKWSHKMYPDNPSLEKVRELQAEGVKNQIKKDDDGWYITLSRPAEIEINTPVGKKKTALHPPMVYDHEGKPFNGLVGDGSDVTTKMEVYSHRVPGGDGSGRAKAMRWDSSRIDTLVPYEPERDMSKYEKAQAEGYNEQSPEQLW